jgi:hypothetical protein
MFYTTLKRLETAATHRQVCLRRLKFFRKERISQSAQSDFTVRYRDLNRPTQSDKVVLIYTGDNLSGVPVMNGAMRTGSASTNNAIVPTMTNSAMPIARAMRRKRVVRV